MLGACWPPGSAFTGHLLPMATHLSGLWRRPGATAGPMFWTAHLAPCPECDGMHCRGWPLHYDLEWGSLSRCWVKSEVAMVHKARDISSSLISRFDDSHDTGAGGF